MYRHFLFTVFTGLHRPLIKSKHVLVVFLLFTTSLPLTHANPSDWVYTMRPGDTIWDFSQKYLKGVSYWQRVKEYNGITTPKRLPPGTRLKVPIAWLKIQPAQVDVEYVTPPVFYHYDPQEAQQALEQNLRLSIGAIVYAGEKGFASFRLADGTRVLLHENSTLVFDQLSGFEKSGMVDTRMRLQRGRVESQVKRQRKRGSRYEITTPAAVAAVRGTQFRTSYDALSAVMRNEVTEGKVNVAAEGETVDVLAGFGTVAKKGEGPQPPQALPDAPVFKEAKSAYVRFPIVFTWNSADIHRYRLQLFVIEEDSAKRLVSDSFVDAAEYEINELPLGRYLMRVRAINDVGLEGMDSDHEFNVEKPVVAPLVLSPADKAEDVQSRPSFSWKVDDATHVKFQLAHDAEMQQLVLDTEVEGSKMSLDFDLPPGQYYWRIAAVDGGELGEYSPVFSYRRMVKKHEPVITAVQMLEDHRVEVAWLSHDEVTKYKLQISQDEGFQEILQEIEAQNASSVLEDLDSGKYYVRLGALYEGDTQYIYASAQTFEIEKNILWPFFSMLLIALLL